MIAYYDYASISIKEILIDIIKIMSFYGYIENIMVVIEMFAVDSATFYRILNRIPRIGISK